MCTKNELTSILTVFADKSRQQFGDKLKGVILFGSYARQDYDSQSDVDLAILLDVPKDCELNYKQEVLAVLAEIDELFNYAVFISPIIISFPFFEEWKNTMPLYKNITAEGVKFVA